MTQQTVPLLEADAVRITIITDNSIDVLLERSDVAHGLPLIPHLFKSPLPVAEHGFSVLIDISRGERRAMVLFDTGVSPSGLLHNLDVLEIEAADIGAIVLSRGHPDHSDDEKWLRLLQNAAHGADTTISQEAR